MKLYLKSTLIFFALMPAFAFAAGAATSNSLEDIITIIISFFNAAIPVLAGLGLLVFFWGVAMFIWSAGNEKKRAEGRYIMIWGIVGLFFMLSIIGILSFLKSTFQLQNTAIPIPDASPGTYNIGN